MDFPFDIAALLAPLKDIPAGRLLYSVFVMGDADAETCFRVMAVVGVLLFVFLTAPRLKTKEARRLEKGEQLDRRRAMGI